MAIEVTTSPTEAAERAARLTMLLSFTTFAIVWVTLMAGAFIRVWTLAEVRDLIILLVGLQAGSLAANPVSMISKMITQPKPPAP